MKKTAFYIMILTLVSKSLGFIRDIVLSYYYGASNITDAYLISLTIPSIIFGIIGAGIATAYIPMQSKIEEKYGTDKGNKYTSNLINFSSLIILVLYILGIAFTGPIVKIFASGFEGDTLSYAIIFTRISLISMFTTGLISIFKGLLQVRGNYLIPALTGVPLNILTILAIIIASQGNIIILAIGTAIANLSQLVFLLIFSYKYKYKYSFSLDLKSESIRATILLSIPTIIGSSLAQINILIDRTIASTLAVGGISALNYANRLNIFIESLFVTSLITVMFPIIAKLASVNKIDELKYKVIETLKVVMIIIIPTTIGAMIFSNQIIGLLFERGAFDHNAVIMTSNALFFYIIGLSGIAVREILSRVYYAMQNTKTPMLNAGIGMIINIILNIILSRYMGISGLALATSISSIITAILMYLTLSRKIGGFGLRKLIILFLKLITSSIIMGYAAYLVYTNIISLVGSTLGLLVSVMIGACIYIILLINMKIDDVNIIIKIIKSKLYKK